MSEIKGFEQLQEKLRKLANLKPELVKTTEKAVKYAESQIPPYPPSVSSYRRTGTLGRTMYSKVTELGSDVVGAIGNNTVYAPWVISAEEVGNRGPQASWHSGRWYTLQDVVKKAKNGIIQIYNDWIKGMLA